MNRRNGGDTLVGYIFALIVAIGFAILLAQAIILPLIVLATFFLFLGFVLKSEDLVYISIILFIAAFVAFVIGFVFGGTEFGKFAINIFNITIAPTKSFVTMPV